MPLISSHQQLESGFAERYKINVDNYFPFKLIDRLAWHANNLRRSVMRLSAPYGRVSRRTFDAQDLIR